MGVVGVCVGRLSGCLAGVCVVVGECDCDGYVGSIGVCLCKTQSDQSERERVDGRPVCVRTSIAPFSANGPSPPPFPPWAAASAATALATVVFSGFTLA